MKKILCLMAILVFTVSAHAQECASSISELKDLVGNNGLALEWTENSRDPLFFSIKNGSGKLSLKLSNAKGPWADVTGQICRKGSNYVAKVDSIVWGAAAPGIVRGKRVSELNVKMPYPNVLKISIMLFSFEFSPSR